MGFVEGYESLGSGAARGRFIVVVHDVTAVHTEAVQEIVSALQPLLGRTMAAAVVPNWHGVRCDRATRLAEWVESQFGEILLHGWTHHREAGGGLISYCTNGSDEFRGLARDETNERLERGIGLLTNTFGGQLAGFVPPAWQRGCVDRVALRRHGLEFLLGYAALDFVDGRRIPVSTIAWDVGRLGCLCPAAECLGRVLGWARPRSLRCLAAHPIDVTRGYLPSIAATVSSWIESGGTPILPCELLCATREECPA